MNLAAWGHQLFIACDQLVNVLIGFGNDDYYADETLSAHCWRKHLDSVRWNVAMRVIDVLFFWQSAHCERAYQSEQKRLGMPPEYRTPNT